MTNKNDGKTMRYKHRVLWKSINLPTTLHFFFPISRSDISVYSGRPTSRLMPPWSRISLTRSWWMTTLFCWENLRFRIMTLLWGRLIEFEGNIVVWGKPLHFMWLSRDVQRIWRCNYKDTWKKQGKPRWRIRRKINADQFDLSATTSRKKKHIRDGSSK